MTKTKNLCMCAFFTVLIAVGAFIKIPTPLPITCQTLFVFTASFVLGSKWGSVSVLTYILIGLLGLPVFSAGGGVFYVMQPTFGYIVGFLLASFIVGKLSESKSTQKSYLFSSLVGLVVIYIIGMVYFYLISRFYLDVTVELRKFLLTCFIFPLPGDIAMCFLSSYIAVRLNKVMLK